MFTVSNWTADLTVLAHLSDDSEAFPPGLSNRKCSIVMGENNESKTWFGVAIWPTIGTDEGRSDAESFTNRTINKKMPETGHL